VNDNRRYTWDLRPDLLQPDQVSVRALHAVAGDDVRVLAKNEAGRSECNAIGPGYVTGAKTASY